MRIEGNTVFITGGSSGIGRGLAEALHQRGNQVIVTGRREERLKELCDRYPGMRYYKLDVTDAEAVRAVSGQAVAAFPAINCVINNAGVQRRHDFSPGQPLDEAAMWAEINTNVLGLVRVTAAFVPHLSTRPDATLVNVSSGLAFVPLAQSPVYCATKAAVHSLTMSLRWQLRDSRIEVIEIVPPWVATELGGQHKNQEPPQPGRGPMPLDEFIAATMQELGSGGEEVAVGGAKWLMGATSPEQVKRVFAQMNG